MVRADLLALTPEDLSVLTSRGAVKRAMREIKADEPAVSVREAGDGTVTADADDGTTVTLPPGSTLEDARCTCAAGGPCRHAVRAVLAYAVAAAPPHADGTSAHADALKWDPGTIADEQLARSMHAGILRRGRRIAAQGLTATLVRSAKPTALLHEAGVTVRFLVPGDPSYARCECTGASPCEHVVAAVQAFRALERGREGGVVETAPRVSPAAAPLEALESAMALLAEAGMAAGEAPRNALRRAAHLCASSGLPWPADVCTELADLCEAHARADALFDPLHVAQLVGEGLLRADALLSPTGAAPPLFAGGPRSKATTEVGGGRLIGLGTRVRRLGRIVDIEALVYDVATRRVLALGRSFADHQGANEASSPFSELAASSLQRRISISAVGAGQLIATGGKRSAAGELRLGRRAASLSAQRFEWDVLLQAPVLVAGVSEARAVRNAAVPAPLGPRAKGANLVVLPLASIEERGFSVATQCVVARARVPDGESLLIVHPYSRRAAGGAERLLEALNAAGHGAAAARFVSGEVRVEGAETVIAPVGLVVESAGGSRRMVQPWVDSGDPDAARAFDRRANGETAPGEAAAAAYMLELQRRLGALLVVGVARADRSVRMAWRGLAESGEALGSVVLVEQARRVSAALDARPDDPHWVPAPGVAAVLALARVAELARAL